MDLKFAWWNCRLSPPSTGAKKNDPNLGFVLSLITLLAEKNVDVLGLCEVDECNVGYIEGLLRDLEMVDFKVVSLFSKQGNAIDDYCLIYNEKKVSVSSERRSLNARGPVLDERLKAGFLVKLLLSDGKEIYVILCHWQSRKTYREGSVYRESLGRALRESINIIFSSSKDALVVICGDFNDEPFDSSIQQNLGASRDAAFVRRKPNTLFNPFWNCLGMLRSTCCAAAASRNLHGTQRYLLKTT